MKRCSARRNVGKNAAGKDKDSEPLRAGKSPNVSHDLCMCAAYRKVLLISKHDESGALQLFFFKHGNELLFRDTNAFTVGRINNINDCIRV